MEFGELLEHNRKTFFLKINAQNVVGKLVFDLVLENRN